LQQAPNEPYRSDHAYERLLKVVEALRGDSATADNILQALRGDVQASAARNVIDSIPELDATQTALSDLLTAQQATTSAIPDLTTIETALATLDTSQQATTSAINGLTLTADNITIDVTTLETRLDSLIDQVERLRGVTADSAAANVDDVFQELDGLRADVATLMSTADDSNFMQIVDIVENLTETQKELISFRKVFSATNFCCDTTIYDPPNDETADDTVAPGSDHCQRVQWYVDTGLTFLNELNKFAPIPSKLNIETVNNLYETRFGGKLKDIDANMVRATANLLITSGEMSSIFANYNTIRDFSFNVDYDGLNIDSTPGLLCALYNGTTAAEALSNLRTSLNKFYKYPDSGFIDTPREAELLLLDIMLATSLDELFAGTIPTDPADLATYDNTACAGCSSSGDCSFIAAGTSVDIASSGPYSFIGNSRTIIEWPAGWPANENDNGTLNVPTTRYVLEDTCLPGLELSFPFDTDSDDVFGIHRYFDDGTNSDINATSTTPYVIPSQVVKIVVFRGGPGGAPYDRPFTLRVTRPL
jgi:hypothetical protein